VPRIAYRKPADAIMWRMDGEPAAIHVMSLNVCGLPSALPSMKERAAHFCRHIDESDIDVVNLQEVWGRRALAVIRARLPSYPFVAWRRGTAGQPAGGLVTFSRLPVDGDPARFPVIDSGLLFTEPLALPDGRRMYLSDHVALTTRIALR